MNSTYLIQMGGIIVLSFMPVSLIVLKILSILSSKHPTGISKTTVICTTNLSALTKDDLSIQSIIFDKYKAIPHQNKKHILLEDTETNEEKKILRTEIKEDSAIKYMAITTSLCKFGKTKALEAIMIDFFSSFGFDPDQTNNSYEIISKTPTKEDKKFSSIVAMDRTSKEIFSFAKGQAGILLKRCSRMMVNGKKIEINTNLRKKLRNKISKLHKNGQKTILFAYKPLPFKKLSRYEESFVENDLVLLGIIGLGETLNTDLISVTEDLQKMGIKQYILSTGKEQKSIAIGHKLGITSEKYFEGVSTEYLNLLNDEQLEKMLMNKEKDYTFFRLTENDQKRIIKTLKKIGEKVRINNMEKENSLERMAEGIKKEKNKKTNNRKVFVHAFSCKIMQIMLLITALIFQAPPALTITLILALDLTINLLMEVILSKETPATNDSDKTSHLFIIGIFGGVLVSTIYIWSLLRFGWSPGDYLNFSDKIFLQASSITFLLISLIQIISAQNLKNSKKSIFKISPIKTPYLSLATIISILILYTITHYEEVKEFMKIKELSVQEWQIIIFVAMLFIIIEELRKYAYSKR
jgi:P-type Ca2+ transporter type 2C